MVFRRKSGAMTKVQTSQVLQKNLVKAETKFEDSDEDDDDASDDEVDAESEQEEIKSENDDSEDDDDDEDEEEGEEKVVLKNSKALIAKSNQQKQKGEITGKHKQQQQKGSLLKIASTPNQISPAKKNQMPDSAQNKRKSTDSALPDSKRPKLDLLAEDEIAIEERRQKERDKRSLFVAQIPVSATEEDIRALSDDIVDVRIPIKRRAQQMQPYAFVEFVSEAKAEENYSKLGNMKLSGQKFVLDFVGEKSKNKQRIKSTNTFIQKKTVNKVKLFVSGIPTDCQLIDITKLFPTSKTITLEPHKEGPKRFAYVHFYDEEAAKSVFKKSDNLKINGRPLTVLYAAEHAKKLKNKKKGKKQKKPQTKMVEKAIKEEDVSDDDEDDDDDDEDDDDD